MEQTIAALDLLIATYIGFLQYDIEVFSDPWLYIPLLVPFAFYLVYFVVKWYILLIPLWLPVMLVKSRRCKCPPKKESDDEDSPQTTS